jgi:hypothetical protein
LLLSDNFVGAVTLAPHKGLTHGGEPDVARLRMSTGEDFLVATA